MDIQKNMPNFMNRKEIKLRNPEEVEFKQKTANKRELWKGKFDKEERASFRTSRAMNKDE